MALIVKDRVLESSTSTGIGSFTLTGAQTGYQSFSAIGNGNTTYYTIQGKNPDGTLTGEWEVGEGTWSTGTTLSRDTVLSNSLGTTAKIDFSAGSKDVFCTYPSEVAITDTNPVFTTDITVNGAKVGVGTSGLLNTLLGVNALTNATSFGNTAIGEDAGSAIVSGNFNTAVGWGALAGDSSESVAIGSRAQNVSAATQSVIIGESASGGLASQSVYVGFKTAFNLTAGSNNVFLGYQAGYTSTSVNNCIAIGANAVLADFTDNVTVIGNTDTANTYIRTASADIAVGGTSLTKVINIGTGASGGSVATTIGSTLSPSTTTVIGEFQLTGSATVNQNIATAQTSGTLTLGGTTGTGAITIGRSTGAQTVNIATGANGNFVTKAVNIGTGATFANSITNITIGSIGGGTLTFGQSTVAQTVNIATGANTATKTVNIGTGGTTSNSTNINIGSSGAVGGLIVLGQSSGSQGIVVGGGATASGVTKQVEMGTGGLSGSTTTIIIGSSTAGSINNTTINGLLKQQTYTVATLPTGSAGARSFVTDALAPSFGVAVAGSGAVGVPVYHDGTSWKVG
jgi:hypothetical protein